MIHLDISREKWEELESYHKEYIRITFPDNLRKFLTDTKVSAEDKNLLKAVFKKQNILFKDNGEIDENNLQEVVRWCISEDIDILADRTEKENLFNGLFPGIGTKKKESPNDRALKENCISNLLKIFGYSGFSDGKKVLMKNGNGWNRHSFMAELGIKVCPYCNRQYITSYFIGVNKDKKDSEKQSAETENEMARTTTDTDHYYPKSFFPLLSMNIHNMIPSCQICNSRMKLNKVRSKEERHLYPYKDKSSILKFEINFDKLEDLYNFSQSDIKISLKYPKRGEYHKRAEQSVELFKLEQIYQAHTDIVYCLKENMKNYSEKKYEKIFCKNYGEIFGSYDEFLRILYPFLNEDEKNVPLTKMKKDIYKFIRSKGNED